MNKEFRVANRYVSVGWSWRGFGLGFRISKWSFDLDLGFLWIGIEF
jgi:hypothetical protein